MSRPEVGSVHVELDEGRCIGTGGCTLAAPRLFDLDEDGVAVLKNADPPTEEWADARAAASACPAMAITVRDRLA